jgi:NADH-quinone oxidoreductase subunit K
MLTLEHYLGFAAILFTTGLIGIIIHRRNMVILLTCLELLLLAVNTNILAFSKYTDSIHGEVMVLLIMAVSAAELAVGLALLVVFYRQQHSIDLERCASLKG